MERNFVLISNFHRKEKNFKVILFLLKYIYNKIFKTKTKCNYHFFFKKNFLEKNTFFYNKKKRNTLIFVVL